MSEKRFSEAKVDYQCAIETKGGVEKIYHRSLLIMLMNQPMDENSGDDGVLLGENSLPPLFRLYHGLAQVCN